LPSQPQGNAPLQTNLRHKRIRRPLQLRRPSQFSLESFERRAGSRIGCGGTQFATHIESGKRRHRCDDIGFGSTGCGAAEEAQLGKVQLATPKMTQSRHVQDGGEVDAGIALSGDGQPGPSVEALTAGLVGGNKQPTAPAAPLPIGGDVKPARLIFSVPPTYPMLAKSQHVSGNVLVDALIDTTGRVTSMNVVSGPTLLHQAAKDALKQWKYQPASLDGKAVPMHWP